jgi:hypothetical protein
MERQKRVVTLAKADDYDTLAAIWVLACNDDDPIITYRGLIRRLGPDTPYDIDDIEVIVASRPELFRRGVYQTTASIGGRRKCPTSQDKRFLRGYVIWSVSRTEKMR